MTAANRFRFRAWDKFNKTMRSPESLEDYALTPEGLGFVRLFALQQEPELLEHLVPLQSTGLCDRNGKEIFEGDILRDRTGTGPGPVVWDSNIAAFSWSGGEDWGMIHCPEIEIIGNIYQNPDLLKS